MDRLVIGARRVPIRLAEPEPQPEMESEPEVAA